MYICYKFIFIVKELHGDDGINIWKYFSDILSFKDAVMMTFLKIRMYSDVTV